MHNYIIDVPGIGRLSPEQNKARKCDDSLMITGGPGTGKSLISIKRAEKLSTENKTVLVLTYTKSLEYYLSLMKERDSNITVSRLYKTYYNRHSLANDYDHIIIDEAQDVSPDIHMYFNTKCKNITFGADDGQILYPKKSSDENTLRQIYGKNKTLSEHCFNRNYRSTKQIMNTVICFYPNLPMSPEAMKDAIAGDRPEVIIVDRNHELERVRSLIQKKADLSTTNIAVLLPSQAMAEQYYEALKVEFANYISKYTSDNNDFENLGRLHITTYKSSKGLEWDMVIMPRFGSRTWFKNNTNIGDADHYVAMTRAKSNLYLLSTDENDLSTLDAFTNHSISLNESIKIDASTSDDDLPF